MRLTTKDRWRYENDHASRKNIEKIRVRDEWITVLKRTLPDGNLDYLELGCAPGQYTAALAEDKSWQISGIDYSDDAELFIDTLRLIGKEAKLYKKDLFDGSVNQSFDIVTSFGLVEHFRGALLDEVFKIHDSYLNEGGYLAIEVPNMTGFHYFWHYLFDRPDLDNHNLDVMQPATFEWFDNQCYETLFCDYVGGLRLWGNSGWTKYRLIGKVVAAVAVALSKAAHLLDKAGLKLRGRTFSPALLYIARKTKS